MGKLIYTKNIPFSMRDWEQEDIVQVWAGSGCAMARTAEGKLLQKVIRQECAARTDYWSSVRDVAISQLLQGTALGLKQDGTCMISKRPVRCLCQEHPRDFDQINDGIKAWRNVIQVAVSDAFFALDRDGKVHHVGFQPWNAGYDRIESWSPVVRIVPGSQDALLGITGEGKLLYAGANPAHLRADLEKAENVADGCFFGSESQTVLLVYKDGSAGYLNGERLWDSGVQGIKSDYLLAAAQMEDGSLRFETYGCNLNPEDYRCMENIPVVSYGIGSGENFGTQFVIAVCR